MDCNYKYFLLTEFASAPTRGSPDAAGYDLKSAYDYVVPKRGKQLIKTDLSFEFPRGCYGRIAPRSGLAVKNAIDVGAGVIDRDYTGNVGVLLFNHSDVDFEVKRGDRIAQLILTVYNDGVLVRGENDTRQTERGNQGFGSTGVRCKTPSSNLVITLEGNIGAGKTTLARALYEEFKKLGLKTAHIQEPVGAWKDFHGTNLLDLLYKDIERWAFAFQSNALVYMTECDRRAVEYSKKGYIVIKERSSFTVRNIFNEKYKAYMTPAEIHILNDLSGTIKDPRVTAVAEGIINDVTLYLKTGPGTCYKRKLQRKRPEEIGKNNMVDEQYLKSLHDIHEMALAKPIGKVVVADGTRFDAQDPKLVRISGSGDLVFEALMQIGGIDVDRLNCVFENNDSLIDEWIPEGDLITIEK